MVVVRVQSKATWQHVGLHTNENYAAVLIHGESCQVATCSVRTRSGFLIQQRTELPRLVKYRRSSLGH
jgi:hypothetical protein